MMLVLSQEDHKLQNYHLSHKKTILIQNSQIKIHRKSKNQNLLKKNKKWSNKKRPFLSSLDQWTIKNQKNKSFNINHQKIQM